MDEMRDETLAFFTSLTECIQMYAVVGIPRSLYLESADGTRAHIALADGQVVHAQIGEVTGVDAFLEVSRWSDGKIIRQTPSAGARTSIEQTLTQLLMEAFLEAEKAAAVREAAREQRLEMGTVVHLPEDSVPQHVEEFFAAPSQGDVAGTLPDEPEEEIPERLRRWRERLQWGELLRARLKQLPFLHRYNVLEPNGALFMHSTHPASQEQIHDMIPERMVQSLRELELLDEDFSLTLSVGDYHHILMRMQTSDGFVLHTMFEAAEVSVALAYMQLREMLRDLG